MWRRMRSCGGCAVIATLRSSCSTRSLSVKLCQPEALPRPQPAVYECGGVREYLKGKHRPRGDGDGSGFIRILAPALQAPALQAGRHDGGSAEAPASSQPAGFSAR